MGHYENSKTTTEQIIAALPAIGAALGGWTQGQADADGDRDWRLRQLHHADGRFLYFSADGLRIKVSCGWPQTAGGEQLTPRYNLRNQEVDGRTTSITVSRDKSPEQIAKDIARRLLPDYTVLHAALNTRAAEIDDRCERAYENAVRVAERYRSGPIKREKRSQEYTVYVGTPWPIYRIQVTPETCRAEISVSPDTMIALAPALESERAR